MLGTILGFMLYCFIDAVCLGYKPKWHFKIKDLMRTKFR